MTLTMFQKNLSLKTLQRQFLASITKEHPNHENLRVYADAWFSRLHESLAEDFPTLQRTLGDHGFLELTGQYLAACPPTSYTLAHAGNALPEFLQTLKQPPWYAELAALERAVYQALHAADATPWDVTTLSTLTEEEMDSLEISLAPAVALIQSNWAIYEVYTEAHQSPRHENEFIVVYRSHYDVNCMAIAEEQFVALSCLHQKTKMPLGQLLEICPADQFVTWISDWAAKGILQRHAKAVRSPGL